MGKAKISISVNGCDDSTEIEMEVTGEELEFLSRMVQAVNKASTYRCMPTITLSTLVPTNKMKKVISSPTPVEMAQELLDIMFGKK